MKNKKKKKEKRRSLLYVHIAIIFLGVNGLFSKLIQLPAIDIIGYRSLMATITLFIVLILLSLKAEFKSLQAQTTTNTSKRCC